MGKRNLRTLPTREPSLDPRLCRMMWGTASEIVPTFFLSPMSCLNTCESHFRFFLRSWDLHVSMSW